MKCWIISLSLMAFVVSCKDKEGKVQVKDVTLTTTDSVTPPPPPPKPGAATHEFLITDTSFGNIGKTTTFDDLRNMFGKNNIQDTMDYGPEGIDSFIVTK